MKIKITELETKVKNYLQKSGLSTKDVESFSDLVIEQEMFGNQFSAVGGLAYLDKEDFISNSAEVYKEKVSAKLIKGNGRHASLITLDCLDEVVSKAKTQGIYALGIFDSTYNEFFSIFCKRIAEQNCISIIVENGGPQGVIPFGGKSDITGTNPLAYGIPTNIYPIIFDAATSMHAYGRIGQAKELNQKLPDNAYVDKNGNVTTDPHKAHAILPFGGFKGYAINLLVDILSGCLVQAKSGLEMPLKNAKRHIGTLIIVIDPEAFGKLEEFKKSSTKLANDLLSVEPIDKKSPVKVPGFRGTKRIEEFKKSGFVEIDDLEWEKFEKAYNKVVS